MGNFKDPDKENDSDNQKKENGNHNGIAGTNEEEEDHQMMVIGNSASASPVTSDTDPEDEGVNLSDMDEDTEIEFKDCDDTFDQNLDRIVNDMVGRETSEIRKDIANMRREVSESSKKIEDAEDLVKEVIEVLESSRRLLENTSHDSAESDSVPNQDPDQSQNLSPDENDDGVMDVDCSPEDSPPHSNSTNDPQGISKLTKTRNESDAVTSLSSSSSPQVQSTLAPKSISQEAVSSQKSLPANTNSISDIHNYSASLQCLPQCDKSPPEVAEPKIPPLKLKLQPKKPPVIVNEVTMPRSFTPPPIRRDPSSLSELPIKPLVRVKPSEGDRAWAMRDGSLMDAWAEARIIKGFEKTLGKGKSQESVRMFKVKFDEDGHTKEVTAKQLAHFDQLDRRIPVGERVIAVYKDEDQDEGDFFPAVIAEVPKNSNKNRYLVFFDDGYAIYLEHKEIRLVYHKENDVWKDVDKGVKNFVMKYIQTLPSRTMITLKEGDKVRTELNGKIVEAEVNDVDACLAQMVFPDDGGCEWIYRGSLRFEPMVKLTETLDAKRRKGIIRKIEIPLMEPQPFTDHDCGPECVRLYRYKASKHKHSNPLRIPLHLGWRREVYTGDFDDADWTVKYKAPCGRVLRNLEEVQHYLWITDNKLEIDFFAFEPWLSVMREFVPTSDFIQLRDISQGKETMPISACNSVDSSYPPNIEYSTVPIPQKGVTIPTDPGFFVSCDCKDGCETNSCPCHQLTIRETAGDAGGRENPEAGYVHRRLQDVVPTGIYECNKTCKCSKTCSNRLVQFPIRSRLQIFKTANRGWGIRALDDLPQGAFVCTYVGKLYGPEEGNAQGTAFGDMYFADLDMIDNVERRKEGYESDPDEDEGIEDDSDSDSERPKKREKTEVKPPEAAEENKESKFTSVRKLYGPDEDIYIMDAMTQGNVGRYLNHSCDPNVFVQNVFTQSHDLRFPSLAFFTIKYVPAGEELCWNYNYVVDSVEGKQITCNCGADNCKGRLL